MDVITIESSAWIALDRKIDKLLNINLAQGKELLSLKDNRLMRIAEVAEYTGFSTKWVHERKEDIGYSQPGVKDIRFYKADVDAYFQKNFIKRK